MSNKTDIKKLRNLIEECKSKPIEREPCEICDNSGFDRHSYTGFCNWCNTGRKTVKESDRQVGAESELQYVARAQLPNILDELEACYKTISELKEQQ